MTETKRPSKPWRVVGPGEFSKEHRSERAAYERVNDIVKHLGSQATVYRWENGDWRLYEHIEPDRLGSEEEDEELDREQAKTARLAAVQKQEFQLDYFRADPDKT